MGAEVAATVIKTLRKRAKEKARKQAHQPTGKTRQREDSVADSEMMRLSKQTFGYARPSTDDSQSS
eukprot:3294050-Rhodomonas_salina.1